MEKKNRSIVKAGLIMLLVIIGIIALDNNNIIQPDQEIGSSGDDLSIQKTEIYDKIVQQDAQEDPDNTSSGNSIHLIINSSGQESFTPSQVKNISHNIYWDVNDIPDWANFTQGYIKISYNPSACSLVSVTSGLFDTWVYRTLGPGEVVLWSWQIGTAPLINDPNAVAFAVTFQGTATVV